jgi:hypothetical protein
MFIGIANYTYMPVYAKWVEPCCAMDDLNKDK